MKAKTKILLSSAALAAAMAVSATSTYAWFTTSMNPTIEGIETTVKQSSTDVEIAVATDFAGIKGKKEDQYKSRITATEMNDLLFGTSGSFAGKKLDAVTSPNGWEFYSRLNSVGKEDWTQEAESCYTNIFPNASHIQFYVGFKSQKNVRVELDTASKFERKGTDGHVVYPWSDAICNNTFGEDIVTGSPIDAKVQNAVRVSFGKTVATKGSEVDTGANVATKKATVYNPKKGAGFSASDNDTTNGAFTNGTTHATANKNLAFEYIKEKKKGEMPTGTNEILGPILSRKPADAAGPSANLGILDKTDQNQHIKDGGNQNYWYGYLQVNIYLEGWDSDCFNAIMNQGLEIEMKFLGVE